MSERNEGDRAGGRIWIAGAIWAGSVALAVAGAVDASRHASLVPGGSGLPLIVGLSAVATAGIGALVAAKTGNLTGWLLAKGGLVLSAGLVASVSVAVACGADRPAATWLVAVAVGGLALWAACLTSAVAVSPSGRMGRGRDLVRLGAGPALAWAGSLAAVVAALTRPAASARGLGLGACAAGGAPAAQVLGFGLLGAGFAVTACVTLVRARRLQGGERLQLMPVAIVAAAETVLLIATVVVEPWARPLSGNAPWVVAVWLGAGLGMPLAVAVSVGRYRTFGIFRLIGFRADYRLWTVGLAAAWIGAAAFAGWGITTLLGVSDRPVAVALLTLAAGAAIFPFWRRRKAIVDARFEQHLEDPAAAIESLLSGVPDPGPAPMRGPVFDLLERFAPMVVVEGEAGMRFAVRTDDREIGRHTFVNGGYDLDAMRCAIELLDAEAGRTLQGHTVLDVGANIGISIVPLLRRFGAERGVAFEPAPDNVEMLRLNLMLNDLSERVDVMPMALSDRDGTLELALSAENSGDHRVRAPGADVPNSTAARRTVTVPVRRLDDLVERGEVGTASLGLIWLDVQGHEGHVLAGARAVLSSPIPVMTEFWPSEMERAGGLDIFRDVVRSCFARVVDVRAAQAQGRHDALASGRIDELVERYAGPDDFTDLLLLP